MSHVAVVSRRSMTEESACGRSPAPMGDLPRVTLVIAVRNEAPHIERCLESVTGQDYPSHLLEIIVVDGDSTDETVEIVKRAASSDERILLLRNPDREMPYALNIG